MRVVDGNDKDVPADGLSIGEIITRADGVMKGYWRQPEASAEALRGGWFHTGDMATVNEGWLFPDCRSQERHHRQRRRKYFFSGTGKGDPGASRRPGSRRDSCSGREVGRSAEGAGGFKAGSLSVTEAELMEFCRNRLAHYKCPRSFEFVDSLPKTATGKILKKELRKKYWQGEETMRPNFAVLGAKHKPSW